MWSGLQSVTNYKQKTVSSCCDSLATPDSLNDFYSRFDKDNNSVITPTQDCPLPPPFVIEEHEVHSLLRKQDPRKAPGPDGVMTSTLRDCAPILAPVFTDIFNTSLSLQRIPLCFKTSSIIPVPKKPNVSTLNDYRPVALTSAIMKIFERIVLCHLKKATAHVLDPFQFAYRANRCV